MNYLLKLTPAVYMCVLKRKHGTARNYLNNFGFGKCKELAHLSCLHLFNVLYNSSPIPFCACADQSFRYEFKWLFVRATKIKVPTTR